jgi:hypothetical protein
MKNQITRIGGGRLTDLWAQLPGYSLVDRLIDVVETRQKIKVIVTSPDYWELEILWGVIKFSKGSKREFLIEGGPGLCEAALRSLGRKGIAEVTSRVIGKRELLS